MDHRRPVRLAASLLVVAVSATMLLMTAAPFASAFTEAETEQPATDQPETDQGTTDTTEGEVFESELGIVPVVEAPPPDAEEPDAPWTQRFLAPAVLAMGVLGLIGSVLYYGVRVRGRYKVVD